MEPSAKVLFRVPNDDGTEEVETLWAVPLGEDKYRLDNLPFYAYGVSLHDTVVAPHDPDQGFPTFKCVDAKSGNRTVRIIFETGVAPGNPSQQLLDELVAMGCDYEGANKRYISVNIPPLVSFDQVKNHLIERGANWEHADPTYDQLHRDDV